MKGWLVGLWIVICTSASGQPLTREQLTGTWIGVHTELSKGVYCPLPAYLDLQTNGTYRLGLIDESAPARTTTWTINGDTLRLGTTAYVPGLVTLRNDTLRIGTVYPITFRRFRDVPVDSTATEKLLLNRVWQTDSLTVHFHDNGRVCLENRSTQQRTVHHWRLARFGQSVFILVQGSQHTTDGHYKPLWQVVPATTGQFKVTGWHGKQVATETFKLVRSLLPADLCQPVGFQACDNCFSERSSFVISGFSLSTSKRYALEKMIRQAYQPLDQAGESGLIQVRFVVNCAGEMGLFTMMELDEGYNNRPFDRRITGQFITICQREVLQVLTSTSISPDDRSDWTITLNFRLKDGHLIEVFP